MSEVANESSPLSGVEYKIVAGALGAIATLVVQKLIKSAWKQITGEEPPNPDDPEASTMASVAWVAASAVGVAVVQVVTRRFAAKRYGH